MYSPSSALEWTVRFLPYWTCAIHDRCSAVSYQCPGCRLRVYLAAFTNSLIWIVALIAGRTETKWSMDWIATLAALPLVVMLLPFLPGVIMSDGMKSLNILVGVEIALLAVILPAMDGLLVRQPSITHLL